DPDPLLADLDAHQRAAVTEPHGPLAILAPAGSGKTRVLTRRIAFRVREERSEARHVLAVTFTRRAAGELVDRLEALGVDGAAAAAERRLPRSSAELADLYAAYEAEKRRKRWLDFDDLLAGCADAIETDGTFAAAQRWRFRDLFVDEFQDATPLQMRLLRAWLAGRADLTVVGDVAQAIYGFAGADASPLAEFRAHFPGGRTI